MITSPKNPKVQFVRNLLKQHKHRDSEQSFIVEGIRLVEEALWSNWKPELVLFSDDISERGSQIVREFIQNGVSVEEVHPGVFRSLAATDTPQGLLAVYSYQQLSIPARLNFVLIIDGVRDPGNLGSLLRTGRAAGVQAVLLTPGTTDAFSPKTLRSGMGAHFRLPMRCMTWEQIHKLCKVQSVVPLRIVRSDVTKGEVYWETNFRQPLALVIGGEAEGTSAEAVQFSDTAITIPMPGGTESLNAGVAGAILLYEVVRQRKGY